MRRVVHDAPVPVEKIIGKMVDVERGPMSPARRMLMLLNPFVRHGTPSAFCHFAAGKNEGSELFP